MHCVYKYVLNDEIIYVGKTDSNLEQRLSQHGKVGDNIDSSAWNDINKSKIYYVELVNSTMCDVFESEMIRRYKPKYNKAKLESDWSGLPFIEPEWKEFKFSSGVNKVKKKQIKKISLKDVYNLWGTSDFELACVDYIEHSKDFYKHYEEVKVAINKNRETKRYYYDFILRCIKEKLYCHKGQKGYFIRVPDEMVEHYMCFGASLDYFDLRSDEYGFSKLREFNFISYVKDDESLWFISIKDLEDFTINEEFFEDYNLAEEYFRFLTTVYFTYVRLKGQFSKLTIEDAINSTEMESFEYIGKKYALKHKTELKNKYRSLERVSNINKSSIKYYNYIKTQILNENFVDVQELGVKSVYDYTDNSYTNIEDYGRLKFIECSIDLASKLQDPNNTTMYDWTFSKCSQTIMGYYGLVFADEFHWYIMLYPNRFLQNEEYLYFYNKTEGYFNKLKTLYQYVITD